MDDMYMGTAVLISFSLLSGEEEHLLRAGEQIVGTARHLTGDRRLLQHGYSHYTGHLSCCRWARGNGWAVLATSDYLLAATELGLLQEKVSQDVMALYRHQMEELLALQSEEGLWHNVLDNNTTFLETSSSAMFLTGLIRGVERGWLENSPERMERIAVGWEGLTSRLVVQTKL